MIIVGKKTQEILVETYVDCRQTRYVILIGYNTAAYTT